MKSKRKIYIPHPLVSREPSDKMRLAFIADLQTDWYNFHDYFDECGNKRWAAHFLVKAIAEGLGEADPKIAAQLSELALQLETIGGTIQ